MPNVSVIVPNYNHERFLERRILSVLEQTYLDFELIILDDCSTDQSRSIVEKYRKHPKVSNILYNDINSGSAFKQWEKGINVANGEFVWIAESDDWCEPSLLETLVAGIESDPQCVVSYCQSICLNEQNETLFISQHRTFFELIDGKQFVREFCSTELAIFNASMALWRKTAYHNLSADYLNFRLSGDWRFWIDMCVQGKVHISGKVLNYFQKHSGDISGGMYLSGLNFQEEMLIIGHLIKEKLVSKADQNRIIKKFAKRLVSADRKMTHEVRRKVWKSINVVIHKDSGLRRHFRISVARYKLKYFLK